MKIPYYYSHQTRKIPYAGQAPVSLPQGAATTSTKKPGTIEGAVRAVVADCQFELVVPQGRRLNHPIDHRAPRPGVRLVSRTWKQRSLRLQFDGREWGSGLWDREGAMQGSVGLFRCSMRGERWRYGSSLRCLGRLLRRRL